MSWTSSEFNFQNIKFFHKSIWFYSIIFKVEGHVKFDLDLVVGWGGDRRRSCLSENGERIGGERSSHLCCYITEVFFLFIF